PTIAWCRPIPVIGFIQASSVSPLVKRRLGRSAIRTWPEEPSKLNARPTTPLVKVTPPYKVPEFESATSLALPSPGHQLIRPEGAGVQLVCAPSCRGSTSKPATLRATPIRTGLELKQKPGRTEGAKFAFIFIRSLLILIMMRLRILTFGWFDGSICNPHKAD